MLNISYAGCLDLSPAISAQSTLKMCVAVQNREKFTKNFYFAGSKSFKVIDIITPKNLLTNACYQRQHVCANLQPFSRWASQ